MLCPKYNFNFVVELTPNFKLRLERSMSVRLDEKRTEDLLKLILWPEALQNLLIPSNMQSTWSSVASTNNKISSAKNEWNTVVPPLEAFNGFHFPFPTSSCIHLLNCSMHMTKM